MAELPYDEDPELVEACAAAELTVPRLFIEPGRAVVGPAGVALYRVPVGQTHR